MAKKVKRERDFDYRYHYPLAAHFYDCIVEMTPNIYKTPIYGFDLDKTSWREGEEYTAKTHHITGALLDLSYDQFREYFEMDRQFPLTQEELQYNVLDAHCGYGHDLSRYLSYEGYDGLFENFSDRLAYNCNLIRTIVDVNTERDGLSQKEKEDYRENLYDFLMEKYFNPKNGGFLGTASFLTCSPMMPYNSETKTYKFNKKLNCELPVGRTFPILEEGNDHQYWYDKYLESKEQVKANWRVQDTSIYKALENYNSTCLAVDTIAKVFWRQPLSAKVLKKDGISDEMVDMNYVPKKKNIGVEVYDKKGKPAELGYIILNTVMNEDPISKDVRNKLFTINRRLDDRNHIPTKRDYVETMECCAEIVKNNTARMDMQSKYRDRKSIGKDQGMEK